MGEHHNKAAYKANASALSDTPSKSLFVLLLAMGEHRHEVAYQANSSVLSDTPPKNLLYVHLHEAS